MALKGKVSARSDHTVDIQGTWFHEAALSFTLSQQMAITNVYHFWKVARACTSKKKVRLQSVTVGLWQVLVLVVVAGVWTVRSWGIDIDIVVLWISTVRSAHE